MILLIDNYDSFTYNLVQYLSELGAEVLVKRNDQITVKEAVALKPERVVVSPGPCTPSEAGISIAIIKELGPKIPTLGVCLGHQSIGQAFGGIVERAPIVMHGKRSAINHDEQGLFAGLPQHFMATRYHSLIVRKDGLPDQLETTAWTDDGIIMGLKHKKYPIYGLQFHPESIMTEHGHAMLKNFLAV
ncbi:MAG: aminodeoxychorismate/anthranilate synthase component II [Chloroflexales bacterium]|nr:aminodeoxychorismate/anthranilate synthase component II [Chloroflexales bacterium]